MSSYYISKEQNEETYVFLRIMIYFPYLLHFKLLQNRFLSNTEMFFYLISKYILRLNTLISLKNSSKKKYQEVTNTYANIGIRVAPAIHQILKNLSDVSGYSISALVRFLIEWECFEGFYDEVGSDFTNTDIVGFRHPFEIVITKVEYHHRYFIQNERVEEDFIWGFD